VTTIKATCPRCGEVQLTPRDIELRVCTHAPASYYVFTCPQCCEDVQKPADDRIIQLLISGGVRATVWELPEEVLEPRTGPPLTHDDLLDFHLLLERPDWFDHLTRVSQGS
jgi:rRNA maturation protein Nop10